MFGVKRRNEADLPSVQQVEVAFATRRMDRPFAGPLSRPFGQLAVGGEVDVGAICGDPQHSLHFGTVTAGQRGQVGERFAIRFIAVEVGAGIACPFPVRRPVKVFGVGGEAVQLAGDFDEFVFSVF